MVFKNLSVSDKQGIIEHLADLRKALLISVVAIGIASIACYSFSEQLLNIVTMPLRSNNQQLIYTGVTEAFFVKLELSFLAGVIIAFPVVSWAIWGFFKPALYPHERKYIYILFPATLILFATGVLFSYFGILPLVLKFFIFIGGQSLQPMFKVDQYVSFVMSFSLPFGIVFELPIIMFFLTKIGIVKTQMLTKNRKYIILAIVIIAGVLTPGPDPISQIMMAVPMYVLFEVSVVVSRFARPQKKEIENS